MRMEWIYIQDKMIVSVFFWVSPGSDEEQENELTIFLYTWFIFSVAFPVMILGLLDRKWVEDSYYVG